MTTYFQTNEGAELHITAEAQRSQTRESPMILVEYEELNESETEAHGKLSASQTTSSISYSASKSLIANVVKCTSIEEFRTIYPYVDISIYAKAMNMETLLKPFIWEVLRDHIKNGTFKEAVETKELLDNEMQSKEVESLIGVANRRIILSVEFCCGLFLWFGIIFLIYFFEKDE